MDPVEQYLVDKSGWPDGPWKTEPDRLEWRHAGFPCLITRNFTGALCGYVACPPGHCWFGKQSDEVTAEVHGGLDYQGFCDEGGKICHVARPGESDRVWWLGFHASHHFDRMPAIESRAQPFEGLTNAEYRDLAYVRAEVESLARQASVAQ